MGIAADAGKVQQGPAADLWRGGDIASACTEAEWNLGQVYACSGGSRRDRAGALTVYGQKEEGEGKQSYVEEIHGYANG